MNIKKVFDFNRHLFPRFPQRKNTRMVSREHTCRHKSREALPWWVHLSSECKAAGRWIPRSRHSQSRCLTPKKSLKSLWSWLKWLILFMHTYFWLLFANIINNPVNECKKKTHVWYLRTNGGWEVFCSENKRHVFHSQSNSKLSNHECHQRNPAVSWDKRAVLFFSRISARVFVKSFFEPPEWEY